MDALLSFDPLLTIAYAVGVLPLGVILGLVLRYLERRAVSRNRSRTSVILNVLY